MPIVFVCFTPLISLAHRIQRNSKRQLIDAESITYFLYVRTSYESLNVNDRVFATVPPAMAKRAPSRKAHHNKSKRGGSGGFDHENVFFDDDCKRFPAEITKIG